MSGPVVISVDAMGGDKGPTAIVGGMADIASEKSGIRFLLHGEEGRLKALLKRKTSLAAITEIRPSERVIEMGEKPSRALRHGKGSSMWNTIDAVADGGAHVAVSCGNTGALMAMSMLRLKRAPGIDRPAIAVMWPSRNPAGYNIVLDVGADLRADARSLVQFAIMGAEYARLGLRLEMPRVGLLNVGTEDTKGSPDHRSADAQLTELSQLPDARFRHVGYVEGSDITRDKVDVIVTDGYTGNIALKTGEGTASLIGEFLAEAFRATPLSRVAAVFAMTSLARLRRRIDPRRVNGGVFLGLGGAVVKSHGGADATGVSAALRLAFRMGRDGFEKKLAQRVASVSLPGKDADRYVTGARKEA